MRVFIVCLIVCSFIFINKIFASSNTDDLNTSLQILQKQRTELYLKFSSLQGEHVDSLKLISANSLLEMDNQMISKIIYLDSIQKTQTKKITEAESRSILKNQAHFIAKTTGCSVLILFIIFFILFLKYRKKYKKVSLNFIECEKKSEKLNSEQIALAGSKEILEINLNEKINKTSIEIKLKDEIIANLESKFKDFSQNEALYHTSKKELEDLQQKLVSANNQKNEIDKKYNLILTEKNELSESVELLSLNNKKFAQQYSDITIQLDEANKIIKELNEKKSSEDLQNNALMADCIKLVEENKELSGKNKIIETENSALVKDLKIYLDEKNVLLGKIIKLENLYFELKTKFPNTEINLIKEMIEQNIETLKIANTKLNTDNEKLEKALRIREPEDALIIKIKKLVEENYNLQLDLKEESIYAEKLNKKLDKYLDELEKQDLELELLNMKVLDRTTPENRTKYDELDLNLIKIEKLNRLKEFNAITEEEYQLMKQNIITQL